MRDGGEGDGIGAVLKKDLWGCREAMASIGGGRWMVATLLRRSRDMLS